MTRGTHTAEAPIPRLDARVVFWGTYADVIRVTSRVTGQSVQDVIRELVATAIEAKGSRPDTMRIRIETLVDADHTPAQIAETLGVTVEYVRTVRRRIRRERADRP